MKTGRKQEVIQGHWNFYSILNLGWENILKAINVTPRPKYNFKTKVNLEVKWICSSSIANKVRKIQVLGLSSYISVVFTISTPICL